jgi:hypothetical protein
MMALGWMLRAPLFVAGMLAGHPGPTPATDLRAAYAAVRTRLGSERIPAFARKYGMKCSACHFAVPILNPYGLAFKDRGYRMKNGTDDLRLQDPSYWPVFAWLYKAYQLDVNSLGDQTVQRTGGFTNGQLVFGGLGSISDHVSFRFTPVIFEDGITFVDAGWVRYNQAFGTDWVNLRIGAIEPDLPLFAGREYNMSTPRFWLQYAYTAPGSVSPFNLFGAWPGLEVMGHDVDSHTRYSVEVFNAPGAPRAHCTFCSPGVFGRVTRRIDLRSGLLTSAQLGVFGSYSTWPVGPDTSNLEPQQRYGADLELWLLSDVLPLRVTATGLTGDDSRRLIPLATRDQRYNSGLLQVDYVPVLPLVFYSRLQVIRNATQAVPGSLGTRGDQDFQMIGAHYYLEQNSRFDWYLELTYARQLIKDAGPSGQSATHDFLWAGTHLVF